MFGFLKKSNITDEEAMGKFQKGDTKCFDLLLGRHSKGVYRFIYRMVGGNIMNAEDILQEVFIKVSENRMNYSKDKKFTAWLYRIARNHTIDFLRKESYRMHSSLDKNIGNDEGANVTYLELVKSDDKTQDEQVHSNMVREQLFEKMKGLKDEYREVFILREIEGLKFDEIAVITDSNVNTVKSRHRYAFKELRELLLSTGFFDEYKKTGEV